VCGVSVCVYVGVRYVCAVGAVYVFGCACGVCRSM